MASMIHYGVDLCHRIPLLSRAGFEVLDCGSLPRFRQLLANPVDAILLAEEPSQRLIFTARNLSSAPLVYFAPDASATRDDRFDLVIEPLTPPELWIASVQGLLMNSRGIQAGSASLRDRSASLRAESAAVRQETKKLVLKARHGRSPKNRDGAT